MGLSYLDNKLWSEVTRDERFFCSHLFHRIEKRGIHDFLCFLNKNHNCTFAPSIYWEVAYEACFYRDLWQLRNKKTKLYSPKRTFDLCLFSEDTIIIIEAKSDQNFDFEQVESFKKDKSQLKIETGVNEVYLSGLKSSKCEVAENIKSAFNGPILTWNELSKHYDNDKILQRADDIFDPDRTISFGKNNVSGYMSGTELILEYKKGKDFFVGRSGGLNGINLQKDILSGKWKIMKYETNKTRNSTPNSNWFLLSELASLIDSTVHPIGIGSDLTATPSHATGHTDRVSGGSADQEDC